MLRLIVSLSFFLTGCAAVWDKLGDPTIAAETSQIGGNLQKIGDATGFPYAGAGLAAAGMFLYLLFGSGKKKDK